MLPDFTNPFYMSSFKRNFFRMPVGVAIVAIMFLGGLIAAVVSNSGPAREGGVLFAVIGGLALAVNAYGSYTASKEENLTRRD